MKKYLFLYAVAVTALLVCGYGRYRRENRRLTQNQHALAAGIERYRTRLGQEAASVQALRLRCAEFEELRPQTLPKSAGSESNSAVWKLRPGQPRPRRSRYGPRCAIRSSCG